MSFLTLAKTTQITIDKLFLASTVNIINKKINLFLYVKLLSAVFAQCGENMRAFLSCL